MTASLALSIISIVVSVVSVVVSLVVLYRFWEEQ